MQVRWSNIFAIGVMAFAVTLGIQLAPTVRSWLDRGVILEAPATLEHRLFVVCVLALLILGVVGVVRLMVIGGRREE